ncbi:hypothetical protein GCM10027072_15980 [Streptomyces bullii]
MPASRSALAAARASGTSSHTRGRPRRWTVPQALLLPQQDPGRLAPDLQQRDPGLVEPEVQREPGAGVERDGLAEVPDGQQHAVEPEQLVRLVV